MYFRKITYFDTIIQLHEPESQKDVEMNDIEQRLASMDADQLRKMALELILSIPRDDSAVEAILDKWDLSPYSSNCLECGGELDIDCQGEPRCPDCDGPCPSCDDGPGPGYEEDAEELYRVTYFSLWTDPIHHENFNEEEKDSACRDGRNLQYKVVVTLMSEDPPTTWPD